MSLDAITELIGKDTTVVIGLTGSGKSTFCQCITVPGNVTLNEDEGVFDGQVVNYDGRTMFEICSSVQSGTKVPGFMPLDGDLQ